MWPIRRRLAVAVSGVALSVGAGAIAISTFLPAGEDRVRSDAGLPQHSPVDPAKADAAVRDYIHRTNIIGSSPIESGEHAYAGLGTDPHACGGVAIAHVWAMQQLGLPARYVQLAGRDFIEGSDQYQTHAVAEVYYDGKWRLSDPTFNIHLNCSDGQRHLSVPEAFACLSNGNDLIEVQGSTTIPGRTLADYHLPYDRLFAAYELRATDTTPREAWPTGEWLQHALSKYPRP
jgi:hypothetical protein